MSLGIIDGEERIDMRGAMRVLGISRVTVMERIRKTREGKLQFPFFQDVNGGPHRFLESELVRWMRNQPIRQAVETRERMSRVVADVTRRL